MVEEKINSSGIRKKKKKKEHICEWCILMNKIGVGR